MISTSRSRTGGFNRPLCAYLSAAHGPQPPRWEPASLPRAIIGLLACVLLLALAPWIAKLLGEEIALGVRIGGVLLLGNMLYGFMQSLFQGFFLMRQRTIVLAMHAALYLATVPVLVHLGMGYLSPIAAFAAAAYASVLAGLVLAWREGIQLVAAPSSRGVHLLDQVGFATPTCLTALLGAVFVQIGVIIIRAAGLPVVEIGYFRAAYNIVLVGSFIAVIFNVVIYPYVSELESRKDARMLRSFCTLIARFLILMAIPASIGFFLVSRPVLEALLPHYLPGLGLMRTLSLMLLFLPLLEVGRTMLLGLGRPRQVAYSSLIATATVTLAGFVLFILAGTQGLALSYTMAALLATAYTIHQLRTCIGLEVDPAAIAKIGLSSLAMGLVVHLAMQSLCQPAVRIAAGISIGLSTYAALVYLLKALTPGT